MAFKIWNFLTSWKLLCISIAFPDWIFLRKICSIPQSQIIGNWKISLQLKWTNFFPVHYSSYTEAKENETLTDKYISLFGNELSPNFRFHVMLCLNNCESVVDRNSRNKAVFPQVWLITLAASTLCHFHKQRRESKCQIPTLVSLRNDVKLVSLSLEVQ